MLTEREFTDAVERYLDMVYRIALNWFRSVSDAEDAAQEVMLRLWKTDTAFGDDGGMRYWLVRVTVNVCRDMARNPWRKRTVSLDSCPEPVLREPAQSALFQAVMDLPSKYRLPLYLHYYEGYSAAEVGELLGVKTSTVLTRLSRGRAKLKAQLEEE